MDFVRRDFGDLPLLRSITEMFGASMWFNTIVVLTHASTAPPEGPNGQIRYARPRPLPRLTLPCYNTMYRLLVPLATAKLCL